MKYLLFSFLLFAFSSCFRFNGQIVLQNSKAENLKIETKPIISSGSGGWENGIHYYNRDSIIWTYTWGNNIHAKIIKPNNWINKDSTFAQQQPSGYHYGDYSMFRHDTSVNGIYAMYPKSSFTIGELNTRKKIKATKNNLEGKFYIKELIIYNGLDTLIAKGDLQIWNLLVDLDKKKTNFDKKGQLNGKKAWTINLE